MEGLLTEITGSLIDRLADGIWDQVAETTTWREWKKENQLSDDDNNFMDVYIEALVEYKKKGEPMDRKYTS